MGGTYYGDYQLIVSEEIVHEYEKILNEHSAAGAAELVQGNIAGISRCGLSKYLLCMGRYRSSPPTIIILFDAAVAGGADFLITNDAHFNEAKKLEFPVINIIGSDEFLKVLIALKR
ncbi:hypothetical protein [Arachidicoccus soli]|uniref:PIN domain-containing protein n=1 Tax=Arachidicoccus soli TaxID=2341117 RepID=A0A386HMH1_9BACT|nr:hypothetical protein [Arachidicoccus soli]AYD46720.1 hypothetical protein D6B99_03260 [Arachidicoccus soli]